MAKRNQIRGICQCCGREQAVLATGRMSQHGYTVANGWFQGVCPGHQYAPMQVDRSVTDALIADVRKGVEDCMALAEAYSSKEKTPAQVTEHVYRDGRCQLVSVDYDSLPYYQKNDALRREIYKLRSRARQGEQFANDLEGLADAYYGALLREVAR